MKSTHDTIAMGGEPVTLMYDSNAEHQFSVQARGKAVSAELKNVIDTRTADGALLYYLRFPMSGAVAKTDPRNNAASSWIAACLRDTFLAGGVYTSNAEPDDPFTPVRSASGAVRKGGRTA